MLTLGLEESRDEFVSENFYIGHLCIGLLKINVLLKGKIANDGGRSHSGFSVYNLLLSLLLLCNVCLLPWYTMNA